MLLCALVAVSGLLGLPGLPTASAGEVDEVLMPGLLFELYELPRRPKTIRNLLEETNDDKLPYWHQVKVPSGHLRAGC